MRGALLESNSRIVHLLQEVVGDLRERGFQVQTGAYWTYGDTHLLWARRGDQTTAVLVTGGPARSLDELSARISLSDWAQGRRDREFVLVSCLFRRADAVARLRRRANRLIVWPGEILRSAVRALRGWSRRLTRRAVRRVGDLRQ